MYSIPPPPPSARPRYVVSEPGFSPESDQSEPKHTSCSIQKTCKCAIWIAVFLGISFGVALSTVNNLNTNDLEKEMLQGNNEIKKVANLLKMVNDSVESLKADVQLIRNATSNISNKTEASVQELKTMLLELFKEFKNNMTDYCTNQTCSSNLGSGSGSGSDSGGQCYNSTTSGCVDECHNMCNGDYQSCATCKGYVTCANRILWQRNCPNSHLVWDDNTKRCESVSNTCQ